MITTNKQLLLFAFVSITLCSTARHSQAETAQERLIAQFRDPKTPHNRLYQLGKAQFLALRQKLHEMHMAYLGKEDCPPSEKEEIYTILRELGVEERKLPPVKRLDYPNQHKMNDCTSITGIWVKDNNPFTQAHEAYHYADKHIEKGVIGGGLVGWSLGGLLDRLMRRIPSIPNSCRLPAILLIVLGNSKLIHGILGRYVERAACTYEVTWACAHGREDELQEQLKLEEDYYRRHPEKKQQLATAYPSPYEYYLYRKQAYARRSQKD